MSLVPNEDRQLIDDLRKLMDDLSSQEEAAAKSGNPSRQKALHHEISFARGLIRSIIQYHAARSSNIV